jgi:hypothetical protein
MLRNSYQVQFLISLNTGPKGIHVLALAAIKRPENNGLMPLPRAGGNLLRKFKRFLPGVMTYGEYV